MPARCTARAGCLVEPTAMSNDETSGQETSGNDRQQAHRNELAAAVDEKTLKRARWEHLRLAACPGARHVNVTNYASGVEAARSGEHTYTVSVGRDGLPTECTCPAAKYQPGPANTSWPSLAVERSSTGPCTATPIRRPTSTRSTTGATTTLPAPSRRTSAAASPPGSTNYERRPTRLRRLRSAGFLPNARRPPLADEGRGGARGFAARSFRGARYAHTSRPRASVVLCGCGRGKRQQSHHERGRSSREPEANESTEELRSSGGRVSGRFWFGFASSEGRGASLVPCERAAKPPVSRGLRGRKRPRPRSKEVGVQRSMSAEASVRSKTTSRMPLL